MAEKILGLKEHEEYVKKHPVPDGFTMEMYRGWRYFLKQDDGSYEVLRVIDIDKDNKSIVTVWNEETNETYKCAYGFLTKYTPLEPFGLVSFNILSRSPALKSKKGEWLVPIQDRDVMIGAHRLVEVKTFMIDPYIVCRQSIHDFFSDLNFKGDPKDNNLVGVSVTRDDCPANINMNQLTSCYDVLESKLVHVYKDDNIDSMMKCAGKDMIEDINRTLKALHTLHCKSIGRDRKSKDMVNHNGWCADLKSLLEFNSFMEDFNTMCEITGVDFNMLDVLEPINTDTNTVIYKANYPATLFFSSVFKVNISDTKIIKFDYSINMGDFNNSNYVMIRDNTNTLWVVVYLVAGEFLEEDLKQKMNESSDLLSKLKLSFCDKYRYL